MKGSSPHKTKRFNSNLVQTKQCHFEDMYQDSLYILRVILMSKQGKSDLCNTFTIMNACSADRFCDFVRELRGKDPFSLRIPHRRENFGATQLAPQLSISTFENVLFLTASFSSNCCEKVGVDFDSIALHLGPLGFLNSHHRRTLELVL